MKRYALHSANSLFDFNALAQEYERWYDTPRGREYDRVQQRDVRLLLPPARSGASLLDVGSGTGHWSRFFLSMGYQVQGIDISPEMIETARQVVDNCTYTQADACEIPFANEIFDVVAAMATLEFVSAPEIALGEMIRCLRTEGILLIGTLNRIAPINHRRLMEKRPPYASAHLYGPEELYELLSPYGTVSMVASSRVYDIPKPKGPYSAQQILNGPFIIAKVQS